VQGVDSLVVGVSLVDDVTNRWWSGVSVDGPATGISGGVRSSGLQCLVKFLLRRSLTQPMEMSFPLPLILEFLG